MRRQHRAFETWENNHIKRYGFEPSVYDGYLAGIRAGFRKAKRERKRK